MATLGEKVLELRRSRQMTQEDLAGIIGVSAQAISKWENNSSMPDIMLLPVIASTFDVSIDELFSAPRSKDQGEIIRIHELPKAAYRAVLNEICSSEMFYDEVEGKLLDFDAKKLIDVYTEEPDLKTGSFSDRNGSIVFANKDMALAYLVNHDESIALLEDESVVELLKAVTDEAFRKVARYMYDSVGLTVTVPLLKSKLGITEEDVQRALDVLQNCFACVSTDSVDMGDGEKITVYKCYGRGSIGMMLFPMLYLARRIARERISGGWYGYYCGI